MAFRVDFAGAFRVARRKQDSSGLVGRGGRAPERGGSVFGAATEAPAATQAVV